MAANLHPKANSKSEIASLLPLRLNLLSGQRLSAAKLQIGRSTKYQGFAARWQLMCLRHLILVSILAIIIACSSTDNGLAKSNATVASLEQTDLRATCAVVCLAISSASFGIMSGHGAEVGHMCFQERIWSVTRLRRTPRMDWSV